MVDEIWVVKQEVTLIIVEVAIMDFGDFTVVEIVQVNTTNKVPDDAKVHMLGINVSLIMQVAIVIVFENV